MLFLWLLEKHFITCHLFRHHADKRTHTNSSHFTVLPVGAVLIYSRQSPPAHGISSTACLVIGPTNFVSGACDDAMFLLYTVIFVLTGIYLWVRHVFSYWERAKFPSLKPSLPFGNFADCCTGRSAMGINVYDLYLKSSEPIVGIYVMLRPMLLARDANLCKSILTTDFASFHDRGVYHNPADPVADHMLMLPGQEWRWIRNKLTPTFTSGKLKGMMPTIIEKAAALQRKLKAPANNSDTIELKELCIRYAGQFVLCAVVEVLMLCPSCVPFPGPLSRLH